MSKKIVLMLGVACLINAAEYQRPTGGDEPPAKRPWVDQSDLAALSQEEKDNRLLQAASEGNISQVEALLAAGADVNKADYHGNTALILAAGAGHLDVVDKLLAAGADVDLVDQRGNTALIGTVLARHMGVVDKLGMVDKLLAAGADINKAGLVGGNTALIFATYNRDMDLIDKLLAAGADINKANIRGRTPLINAARKGYEVIIKRLFENLAIPPTEEEMTRTQLSENAKNLIKRNIPLYLDKLQSRAVAEAKQLDRQGMSKDLIMLTLEQTFGPYVRDSRVKSEIDTALAGQ